jgi:hypothetical protein
MSLPLILAIVVALLLSFRPGSGELGASEVVEVFRDNVVDRGRWRVSKSTPQVKIVIEDEALVTTVDPSFQGVAVLMDHLGDLTGDFEVRCDLEVLESPVIQAGWINLELVLIGADGQFHSMMGLDRNGGSRFSALYMPSAAADKLTRKYTFVPVEQKGTNGTLCLQRIGTEIIVGIIREEKLVEIKRFACDTTPMRLRSQCFMREAMPGPTKFRFDNFKIRPLIPEAVVEAFKVANRNGDQALSVAEFIAGRDAADVAKRDFKLYDFNEDGGLNLEEFACVRGAMAFDQPGVLPDYLTSCVDQAVAALDQSFGNWDQNPQRDVNANQFIAACFQELQALSNNTIHANLHEADPNQDQKVSRSEARRFIEIQLGVRRSDGKLLRYPNGMVVNQGLWLHLDVDKNGVVDRAEYLERSDAGEKAVEEFTKADIDCDEVMSFHEFIRVPWRGFIDPVHEFRIMDKNLDARLDRQELIAGSPDSKKRLAQHAFPGFDLNQDGVLSLVEYCLTPQANMILHWPTALLDDGDGALSFAEFDIDQSRYPLLRQLYFQRLDRNGDKRLTIDEFDFKK